jgi:pimeloyl-ACP methyl ester carboxylesterase
MKKISKILLYLFLLLIVIFTVLGHLGIGNVDIDEANQGELISIGDQQIRYLQKGTGTDFLLIHGTPGCIEDWQLIIDSLSEKYRVTAIDRLGNGFSSSNDYQYTLEENSALVHKLIDTLGLKNTVIIGHSFGGSTTAQLATENNPKIDSYIMVSPPLYQIQPATIYKIASIPLLGKGFAYFMHKTKAAEIIGERLKNELQNRPEFLTPEFIEYRSDLWSQPKVLYTTSKERINYNEGLDKISSKYSTIPSFISIIVGDLDSEDILEGCIKFKEVRPETNLVVLKNTRHFVQIERNEQLLKEIEKHLLMSQKEKN